MILVRGVLHSIMHSDDTQACHSLAYLVHNPRHMNLVLAHLMHMIVYNAHTSRRDRMCNLVRMNSRDRNRRT